VLALDVRWKQAHIEGEIQRIANNYTLYSSWFK
jgi:hypothetical protein